MILYYLNSEYEVRRVGIKLVLKMKNKNIYATYFSASITVVNIKS